MKEQKKQNKVLLGWTLAWVVSLAFLTGAENTLWNDLIYTKIGLLINLVIGIVMIVAHKNLFKTFSSVPFFVRCLITVYILFRRSSCSIFF